MQMFRRGLLLLVLIFFAASTVNAAGLLKKGGGSKAAILENGMVLNVDGDTGYYFYINGYAAHIPSPAVYQCMELEKNRIVKISQQQLENFPKTAFLIRGSNKRVYRVTGDTRRLVPNSDVFKKLGFNELEIIGVSDQALSCIQKGPALQ